MTGGVGNGQACGEGEYGGEPWNAGGGETCRTGGRKEKAAGGKAGRSILHCGRLVSKKESAHSRASLEERISP